MLKNIWKIRWLMVETTRVAVNHGLTGSTSIRSDLWMRYNKVLLRQDATRASGAYVDAERIKNNHMMKRFKMLGVIAGLNNPTINKGNGNKCDPKL